ncbi:hypothetical protein NXT08_25015 (plasmid) [Rhodococcus pyridinivorans]|nr:hypothetical protein [Rhodococcus pyridinivorans]UVT27844.1 hypothetical protein NXT08_25015 [Rhodococcus pyridinivorans]
MPDAAPRAKICEPNARALKRLGARDDRIYTDKGYTVADAHTYAVRS